MNHRLLFLESQVAELQEANAATNGRRARKRKRIQQGGTLTFKAGQATGAELQKSGSSSSKRVQGGDGSGAGQPTQRRCGNCGGTGHNSRTCQKVEESPIESDTDEDSIVSDNSVE